MDRPTALVVEDDPSSSRLVGEILRKRGVDAKFVVDGIDALVSLHDSIPDLVILDIALPRVDGWQVLHALRMGDLAGAVPIIVITAHGQGNSARRAFEGGADRFFEKPFMPAELAAAIQELLPQNSNKG
ncbi:MAG: response regulator [Acidimicrobiia bacterium]|nr:response regulator [Acidimicrobiia bacterium]